MAADQQTKLLGSLDTVLLSQDVHRVLLRVSGDYVGIITVQVILLSAQRQMRVHLKLSDGVKRAISMDVEEFYVVLSVTVIAELVFVPVHVVQTAPDEFRGSIFANSVAVTVTSKIIDQELKIRDKR